MASTEIDARALLYWLLLCALTIQLVICGKDVSQLAQEERKLSPVVEWKNDFGVFLKRTQSRAGKAVDDFLKPTREFLASVQRYQRWQAAYGKLCDKRKSEQSGCLSANELLMSEYSKIDHELHARALKSARELGAPANEVAKEAADEKSDDLLEVLKRLIDRLEALQESIERGAKPVPDSFDKKAVDESIERLKRSILKTVQEVAVGEAIALGRIAAFKMFAIMLALEPPMPGSPLSYLAPLIAMLGSSEIPLPAHYLLNVKLRAIVSAFDGLIGKLAAGLKDRDATMETAGAALAPEMDGARALRSLTKGE